SPAPVCLFIGGVRKSGARGRAPQHAPASSRSGTSPRRRRARALPGKVLCAYVPLCLCASVPFSLLPTPCLIPREADGGAGWGAGEGVAGGDAGGAVAHDAEAGAGVGGGGVEAGAVVGDGEGVGVEVDGDFFGVAV